MRYLTLQCFHNLTHAYVNMVKPAAQFVCCAIGRVQVSLTCVHFEMHAAPHFVLYTSGSQPVVSGPPVVCSHLPGVPQARPKIYLILTKNMQKEKYLKFLNFLNSVTRKQPYRAKNCVNIEIAS